MKRTHLGYPEFSAWAAVSQPWINSGSILKVISKWSNWFFRYNRSSLEEVQLYGSWAFLQAPRPHFTACWWFNVQLSGINYGHCPYVHKHATSPIQSLYTLVERVCRATAPTPHCGRAASKVLLYYAASLHACNTLAHTGTLQLSLPGCTALYGNYRYPLQHRGSSPHWIRVQTHDQCFCSCCNRPFGIPLGLGWMALQLAWCDWRNDSPPESRHSLAASLGRGTQAGKRRVRVLVWQGFVDVEYLPIAIALTWICTLHPARACSGWALVEPCRAWASIAYLHAFAYIFACLLIIHTSSSAQAAAAAHAQWPLVVKERQRSWNLRS